MMNLEFRRVRNEAMGAPATLVLLWAHSPASRSLRFSPNEFIATSAATPSTIDEIKRRSLPRLPLLSRHAILKDQASKIFMGWLCLGEHSVREVVDHFGLLLSLDGIFYDSSASKPNDPARLAS